MKKLKSSNYNMHQQTEVVRILENLEKQSGSAKKAEANKPKFVADERNQQ